MKALFNSLIFAGNGVLNAWTAERNFRVEVLIGLSATILAIVLKTGLVPVLICTMLVLALELFNSSIEALVDLTTVELHPLAKNAKDYAAAAVLLTSLGSLGVGIVLLGPPLIDWVFAWL